MLARMAVNFGAQAVRRSPRRRYSSPNRPPCRDIHIKHAVEGAETERDANEPQAWRASLPAPPRRNPSRRPPIMAKCTFLSTPLSLSKPHACLYARSLDVREMATLRSLPSMPVRQRQYADHEEERRAPDEEIGDIRHNRRQRAVGEDRERAAREAP